MAGFGGFGTPAATGGGLFGATSAAATGTGLFGAASAPASNQGGLFGANSAGAAPGGLFGAQATQAPVTGGLFGSTGAPTAATGGLFGAAQPQPALGGGLFGQSQQSPAGGGALFQTSAAAPATGLFGATTAAATTGLFGATSTAQPASGLFGAAPAQGLFNSAPAAAPFGAAAQPNGGLFGAMNAPLGQQQSLFGAQNTLAQPQQQPILPSSLQAILDAYDPSSPSCRFRHMFYNVVLPETVHRYTRPQNTDQRLWELAMRENPDPARLVPVQASGFDDLAARVVQQETRMAQHLAVLSTLERSVRKLQEDHELVTGVKLAEYRRRHRELVRKLMTVSFAIERILSRGKLFSPEEAALRRRVLELRNKISGPGQIQEKLADIEDLVKSKSISNGDRNGGYVEPLDTKSANSLKGLLAGQLDGISHLMKVAQLCERDSSILLQGYLNLSTNDRPVK